MDVLGRIMQLRTAKGWTEYQLAKASDLPQTTISSWYKKNMLPSITSLEKICNGFGITMSQFFCNGEESVDLTDEQKLLLERYLMLSPSQKETLNIFLNGMLTK